MITESKVTDNWSQSLLINGADLILGTERGGINPNPFKIFMAMTDNRALILKRKKVKLAKILLYSTNKIKKVKTVELF